MAHVFFCYAKKDVKKVDKLYKAITDAGFKVWMDMYDLHTGDLWKQKIRKAIKDASAFVACFSKNFMESPRSYSYNKVLDAIYQGNEAPLASYRDEEVRLAMKVLKRLPRSDSPFFLPILLDDGKVPRTIREKYHVTSVKSQTGIKKLVCDLVFCRRFPRKGERSPLIDNAMQLSIDYKERGRDQVVAWGVERAETGVWNWHRLGRAMEYYLDAIQYCPKHQHPWTNIAYVYHLIGQTKLAQWCIERSQELAEPGENHPGRNCKQVTRAMEETTTVDGHHLEREPMPSRFKRKYADFLAQKYGKDTWFRNVSYYTEDWPPKATEGS